MRLLHYAELFLESVAIYKFSIILSTTSFATPWGGSSTVAHEAGDDFP